MRLIQFVSADGRRGVGVVEGDGVQPLAGASTSYALVMQALEHGSSLEALAGTFKREAPLSLETLLAENRVLLPIDHPDPAHCLVTGTGLTHLGSAAARDKMHAKLQGGGAELTDSMKIFKLGLEGGKPAAGEIGVQPEWFYKGDGGWLVPPGAPLSRPGYALDGGEEGEIVAAYVIGPDRRPYRVGFALANEFSDHIMERSNYLYLAHSKLRQASFGPELVTGDFPQHIAGEVAVLRGGRKLWSGELLSGEGNMSHSLANLEHHHFKYAEFRRPGDLHIHFFGAVVLSFAEGIRLEDGDVMQVSAPGFGRPLRNPLKLEKEAPYHAVTAL